MFFEPQGNRSEIEIQEHAHAGERQGAVDDHQHRGQGVAQRRMEIHRLFVGVAQAQAGEQRRGVPDHHVDGVVALVETAGQGEG